MTILKCKRCGDVIPSDRIANGISACKCGWYDPTVATHAEKKIHQKVISVMVVTSLALLVSVAQLTVWGKYAYEMPILKLKQLTGRIDADGYRRIATICIDLGKSDCASDAYFELFHTANDVSGLANLGKLQMRIGKQDEAIKSFKDYLDAGGNSYDASLNLAHTLDIEGQKTEAMKYYGLAINQARDVLPVQAVSAMVHLLISQGQYKTALQQIDEFYAADDSAKGYLNTEHAQLLAKVAETEPVQATAPSVALDAPAADLTADAVAVMATDRNPASNPTAEKHAESQKP